MTVVLAVDVGTTAVKAARLVDGVVVQVEEVPLELSTPRPGWAEQDPDDWWDGAVAAITRLDVGDADAISVTGQMQDLIPLDAAGRPVRPAILYSDGRATVEHDELVAGWGADWFDAIGGPVDATNVAAKWRWLQRNEPDAVREAALVLLGGHSVVVQRLCGAVRCDPTTAATTGLLDLDAGTWWQPAVDELALPAPELGPPASPAGWLASSVASALELPASIPVFHANGDAVATTLALVGGGGGRPYASLGTSGWVADVVAEPVEGAIVLPVGDGRLVSIAPILTAGGAIDWARDALFGGLNPGQFDRLAAGACGAQHGVLFLPHLDGVRFPVASAEATGVLVGARRSTGRGVIAAAVVEGVAHALRPLVELVAPDADELAACGGGARSDAALGALADVLGRPVVRVDDAHAGLLGAAMAAHEGIGAEPPGPVSASERFVPDPARHRIHEEARLHFDELVPTMQPTFERLAALRHVAR
ncbi:MAG: FGGY family carbohydrate kinase [Actinomycetota bacterium]